MFLTRVELVGFKSFADKTVCALGNGITAVVGPNGCGKSNIVEAIRWVLGEQRPSMLRGRAMGDVIFSGSNSTGPVSMAQVTLVFDNSARTLPVEAPEVAVTRRLYRDGESRYFLNMRQCMLREIKEALYNSGLGAPEYAIMQREMIDTLLANRASERRVLIEEAAGIMRYRAHIKQSLSRLQSAEASILRLSDVVQERERIVRKLKIEAGHATRAKRYRQRMGELRAMIAAAALRMVSDEVAPLRQGLEQAQRAAESAEARRASSEARLEAQRLRLAQHDGLIADTLAEASRIRDELTSASAAVTLLEARGQDLAEERARIRREKDEVARRRDQATGSIAEAEQTVATLAARIADIRADLERYDRLCAEREAAARALREEARAVQTALAEVERDLQSVVHEREKRQLQLSHAVEAAAARLESSGELIRRRDEAAQRAQNLSLRLADIGERLDAMDLRITRATLRRDKAARVAAKAETAAREAALGERDVAARRDVMHHTVDAREGFSEGARFLMARKPEGLLGLLGEEVVPHPGFERAVEAALAESVDFVVVEHRGAARRLLGMLREARASRAKVVECELAARQNGTPPADVRQDAGIVGPLMRVLDAPKPLMPVVRSLLGRTLLLRTLPEDHEVHALWRSGWNQLVTMEGDVLRADGVHQGGANAHGTLLGRRRDLERIDALLRRRALRLRICRDRAARLNELRTSLAGDVDACVAQRQSMSLEHARLAAEHAAAVQAASQAAAALEAVGEERARAEEAIRAHETAKEGLERDVAARLLRRSALAEECARAVQLLDAAEKDLARTDQSRAPLRHSLADSERELASAQARAEGLRLQRVNDESLIGRFSERDGALDEAIRRTAADRADAEARAAAARARLEEIEAVIAAARAERVGLAEQAGALEREAARARDDARREQETLHHAQIEVATRDARLQEIIAHTTQDLGITAQDLARLEPTGPLEALETELAGLKARCDALGDVNIRADEQCAEESAELERLRRELNDARESRNQLLHSIEHANRTARERFTATFERVNSHFQAAFSSLLPGCRARLELPGEGSILTRDINMVVQPPGKRSRPVELLSGGERALTALAFLFGVYREKAGPLCVLDEVDAPLDDANTARFMDMLESLASSTQFLIVTHNKHTMSRAARLIGVTMESGVSRLVPVELRKQGVR